MTVLIAVNTRDAIIMAADSQGTVTRPLIDPKDLSEYFDEENGRKLRTGSNGRPLLDTWSHIAGHALELPCKIHYNVEKIFSLEPLNMGIMVSGISSIGDRTIKSLINEFKTTAEFTRLANDEYTLKKTAALLLDFLYANHAGVHSANQMPGIELMLCGYDKSCYTPGMARIYVSRKAVSTPDHDFCIYFGGITREIQRMLFGIDAINKTRLMKRSEQLLGAYRDKVAEYLKNNGIEINLPAVEELGDEYRLFHNLNLDTLQMNCATYSEYDAVECAGFLVNVMVNSQRFSNQIPTTGGAVQMAIIRKQSGFEFIKPEHPVERPA